MNVLIDTGFWFAYYDGSDQKHQEAINIMGLLEHHQILMPFPSLYETINTRFSRRKEWAVHFSHLINSSQSTLIQDDSYKDATVQLTFESALIGNRAISMVDMVIRQMLDDVNLKVDAMITFNPDDFSDICRKRKKVLIYSYDTAGVLP